MPDKKFSELSNDDKRAVEWSLRQDELKSNPKISQAELAGQVLRDEAALKWSPEALKDIEKDYYAKRTMSDLTLEEQKAVHWKVQQEVTAFEANGTFPGPEDVKAKAAEVQKSVLQDQKELLKAIDDYKHAAQDQQNGLSKTETHPLQEITELFASAGGRHTSQGMGENLLDVTGRGKPVTLKQNTIS